MRKYLSIFYISLFILGCGAPQGSSKPLDNSVIGRYCYSIKQNNTDCHIKVSRLVYSVCGGFPEQSRDTTCQKLVSRIKSKI